MESIITALKTFILTAIGGAAALGGGTGTINQIDQWRATNTPDVAITQSVPGKALKLTGYDCTGFTNGGTLTTDASGNVTCQNDDGGGGGSLSGGIVNALAYWTSSSNVGPTTSPTVGTVNATRTDATSTLPWLDTTRIKIASDYITDLTGTGLSVVSGALTLVTSGDWTGTFDGQEGSYYLSNSFSTTSANYWETQQTARTADDLTNNQIDDLSDVATLSETTGDLLSWNGSAWIDVATSTLGFLLPGGALNGTFDGLEGSAYLDRANHTGTQLAATISDFASTVRTSISETITGIDYDNGTGIFSLTTGFNIPTTASTTAWNSFTATPSTVITAGTNLFWSGNTLNGIADGRGIGSFNGLTVATQTLATTSANTGWGFTSSGSTHTLNIPTASANVPLGLLSSTDWTTFNSKQAALTAGNMISIASNIISATGIATTSIDTSSELRSILTDETGTGALMFGITSSMSDDLSCTGSQVIARNLGDTAWECVTQSAGGGGGGMSTTTDNNNETGELISYITTDFYVGGSASNTAELNFDKDTSKLTLSAPGSSGFIGIATTSSSTVGTSGLVVQGNGFFSGYASTTNFSATGTTYLATTTVSTRLGIGTTSPSNPLSVVGNAFITGNAFADQFMSPPNQSLVVADGNLYNYIEISGTSGGGFTFFPGSGDVSVSGSEGAQILNNINTSFASTPSYAFFGDEDSGLASRDVANEIALVTGGSERLTVGSTGFIGIGSSSPSRTLSVAGDAWFNGISTSSIFVGTSTTGTSTAPRFSATTAIQIVSDFITDITGFGLAIVDGALGLDTTGAADEECLTYEDNGAGADGIEWQTCGGGGGTPGGSDTQIQFNDAGVFGGAVGFIWNKVTSRLGIGTTTPFGVVSIQGGTWDNPAFVVASTSGNDSGMLSILSTTTNLSANRFNQSTNRIAIGNYLNGAGTYVPPMFNLTNYGTYRQEGWATSDCPGVGFANVALSADGVFTPCPDFGFYEDNTAVTAAGAALTNGGYYFTVGNVTTANDGFAINFGAAAWVKPATNTPIIDVSFAPNGAATSTRYYIGFSNTNPGGSTFETHPTIGCYLVASSTQANWILESRTSASAVTTLDTGIASTTVTNNYGAQRRFIVSMDKDSCEAAIQPAWDQPFQYFANTTNIATTTALNYGVMGARATASAGTQGAAIRITDLWASWRRYPFAQ